MSTIKRLREIGSLDTTISCYSSDSHIESEKAQEVQEIFWNEIVVDKRFEDGGRWSNFETTIIKITEGEEVAYFLTTEERPATEQQEGGDFTFLFYEVEPIQVTVTQYQEKGN